MDDQIEDKNEVETLISRLAPELVRHEINISTSALAYCLACNLAFGIKSGGLDVETVVDNAVKVVRQAVAERLSSMEASGGKRDGQSIH